MASVTISALTTEFSSDMENFPIENVVNSHSLTDRGSGRGSSVMTGPPAWSSHPGVHRADGADEFTGDIRQLHNFRHD